MAMGSRLGLPWSGTSAGTPQLVGFSTGEEAASGSPRSAVVQLLASCVTPPGAGHSRSPSSQSEFTPAEQEVLHQLFGPAGLRVLRSLHEESDWTLFYEDLYSLGRDLQRAGHRQGAERIFSFIAEGVHDGAAANEGLRSQAGDSLAVLRGGGPFGLQLEDQFSRFADEVTDPIALISMGAAGLTYGAVRLGTFGLLSRTRVLPLLTRGWGAQGLAFMAGVGAESVAFMGVGRGLHTLAGQPQDWSSQSLSREFLGTAMMLGLLKLGGGLARGMLGHPSPAIRAGMNSLGRVPHVLLPQLAMFGGIYGSHWMEERLGWRQPGSDMFLESLVTLAHFNAVGRLSESVFGSAYADLNRDLHQRSEVLRQRLVNALNLPPPVSDRLAYATGIAGAGSPSGERSRSPWPRHILMMAGNDGKGGRGGKPGEEMGRAPTLEAPPGQLEAIASSNATDKGFPPRMPPPPAETPEAPVSPVPEVKPSSSNPPRSSRDFQLHVGMELEGGKYTVMELLGEGGMKEVWLLHDHSYDRSVVLYLPHPEYRERLAERFQNEYRLQVHLSEKWRVEHHAILDLAPGLSAPVVAFVPGQDLFHFVAEVRRSPRQMAESLPLGERLEIFAQLCEAVQANHELGVLHRDIKPENVRLDGNGRVRLLDYGVAKLMGEDSVPPTEAASIVPPALKRLSSSSTMPGRVVGTPGYVAPELFYSDSYLQGFDPRQSEVFSLGAVLYELTTGYQPFSEFRRGDPKRGELPLVPILDRNGHTKISMHKTLQGSPQDQVPTFDQLIPFASQDPLYLRVESIARRALSPLLQERYRSAEELRQAVLMAEPWVEKQELDQLFGEIGQMEEELSKVGPNFQLEGKRDPHQTNSVVQLEQDLRYLRTRWLREGESLIQGLRVAMGGSPFPEGQRMIADLSWQQLLQPGSRIHPADERVLRQRIEENDVPFGAAPGGLMRRALQDGTRVEVELRSLDPDRPDPLQAQLTLVPIRMEKGTRGLETGNYFEGTPLPMGPAEAGIGRYHLAPGHYVFEWEAEGFAPMRVPVYISPDQVLTSLREKRPFPLHFEMVPREWVPEGMTVIQRSRGTIGHNYYFDGDTALATSFPMRQQNFPTFAVSRDPVTVGEYRQFIESLLQENNSRNADDSTAFKAELRRIQGLLPQTKTALDARGPLAKLIKRFSASLPTGTPFWIIEEEKRLKVFSALNASLVDPTTHPDPFGAEIHADHPVAGINYRAALEFAAWRSRRDGVSYRIIGADEKEMVARNGFDWRFPFGNGSLTDTFLVTRGSFDNADDSAPQRVGTHPMGTYRDQSLHGVRDLLGNIREFTSTFAEENSIFLSGGSITLHLGANFNPSSRYILNTNQIWDGTGGIRLAMDFPVLTEPQGE